MIIGLSSAVYYQAHRYKKRTPDKRDKLIAANNKFSMGLVQVRSENDKVLTPLKSDGINHLY
jgi:hypothetical protein